MIEEYDSHRNYQKYIRRLNNFYKDTPALWERDFTWEGFSWISNDDYRQSIIIFRRFDKSGNEVIIVCNFVPVARTSYCFGVPYDGEYTYARSGTFYMYRYSRIRLLVLYREEGRAEEEKVGG